MSLEQKVMADLKAAMLAKNEGALRGLRAIKAAIIIAKTAEGSKGELKEEDEVKLLTKLIKQRKDSLEIYQQQQRERAHAQLLEALTITSRSLDRAYRAVRWHGSDAGEHGG